MQVKKITLLILYYVLGYVIIVNCVNCVITEDSPGRNITHIVIAAFWAVKLINYYFPRKNERTEDEKKTI